MFNLNKITEFDWDEGNSLKNQLKHNVLKNEAEDVFFNSPLLISDDTSHSQVEKRYHALGKTTKRRFLHITFTVRDTKIRIISARDMNKKEQHSYENNSNI